MLRIASITRSRSFGRTVAVSLITCDTVPIETPARSAICRIVTGATMTCPVETKWDCNTRHQGEQPADSPRIYYATESDASGAVQTGGRQQQLAVLVQFVRLREVPDRALRLIVTAAAENTAPRMLVNKLLGPLPDVSYHVHHVKGTCSLRMCVDRIRTAHGARLIGHRDRAIIPLVAPRIE